MTKTLEAIEAEVRDNIDALRRCGFDAEADRYARLLNDLTPAIDPVRLLPEHTAMTRTGKRRAWLNARFAGWLITGSALQDAHGERWYRSNVLPIRGDLAGELQGAADAEQVLAAR